MEYTQSTFLLVLEQLSKLKEDLCTLTLKHQQLKEEHNQLKEEYRQLKQDNERLVAENQALTSQLHRDSHNSSQPPSSDGLKKKVVNSRVGSGRKIGGQPGHKGSTLNYAGDVDKIISHFPKESCTCGIAYRQTKQSTTYVLDLPKLNSEVTQHISEHWHCRKCGKTYYSRKFKGNKEQYGEQLKSLAIYLKT